MRPRNIAATIIIAATVLLLGAAPESKAGPPCLTNVTVNIPSSQLPNVSVSFTLPTGCSVTSLGSGVWQVNGLPSDHAYNCANGADLKVKVDFNNHGARCDGPAINPMIVIGWNNAQEDPPQQHYLVEAMPATGYAIEYNVYVNVDAPACLQTDILGCILWWSGCTSQG